MRQALLAAVCLLALAATAAPAANADWLQAIKADVAAGFEASPSEVCAGVKGQEAPDRATGSPMTFSGTGEVRWGKGSLNYVKARGATVTLDNHRAKNTYTLGIEIYDLDKGGRPYVAGLDQMLDGALGATVTDATQAANGNTDQTTSNLCMGRGGPTLPAQGLWPLAAKYLRVPTTSMSCFTITKFERVILPFAFDGKTLQAGAQVFGPADAAQDETLIVNPQGDKAPVSYSVTREDESGVTIGLARTGVLSYASLRMPGGAVQLLCSPL
jgi:hypothetical protein